jgi:hypothetical protein
MRQQFQLRSLPLAIGLAGLIVAAPIQCTYARGRGGFPHGGFSRGGPAAAGGFASHAGSMAGRERGLESGARGVEANRMEQANRMGQANRMEQAAQQYRRAYPYAGAAAAWDAGAAGVAAATTAAAIGSAAAATAAAPAVAAEGSAPAAYAAQPCANAISVPVGRFTLFRCGTAWYRQAYGPAGPTFVQVAVPNP